jgi:hypothetical protein
MAPTSARAASSSAPRIRSAWGRNLRFEFSWPDGQPLLLGHGTVVWVREPDQARAGVVPGMGVRFDKLTGHSQNVLGTILAGKAKRDGSGAARVAAPGRVSPTNSGQNERMAGLRPSAAVTTLGGRTLTPAMARPTSASDPWQSDKTEIARMPPNFLMDPPRSEELSLSGAEEVPAAPPPPAPVVSAPASAPARASPGAHARAGGVCRPRRLAVLRRTWRPCVQARPACARRRARAAERRRHRAARLSSPGMAIGEDDGVTDKFSREHQSVTGPLPTPGRGKMLVVSASRGR